MSVIDWFGDVIWLEYGVYDRVVVKLQSRIDCAGGGTA